jgi:hypothetical protein
MIWAWTRWQDWVNGGQGLALRGRLGAWNGHQRGKFLERLAVGDRDHRCGAVGASAQSGYVYGFEARLVGMRDTIPQLPTPNPYAASALGRSGMDNLFQFRVGDRVRARTSRFVLAGRLGIIRQVLYSSPRFFFVQFDGFNQSRLMHARDLERVTEEPEARP